MNGFNELVGGKWWKIDFHLHSPGSYDYGHGSVDQKNVSPEDYLKSCMQKELDCIVVSDHNTFEWIPKLRTALCEMREKQVDGFREIIIFPGVELNVQGNVHLICIFDPDIDEKELFAIPYLVEYDETLETTKKSINDVIEIIVKKNGIAIPAHVDAPSGLFYDSKPTVIKAALQTGKLLALEVLGDGIENAIYKASKQKLSFVVGSDSHTIETIGDKYTWVKMGSPNIEALRLALFDTEDGAIRYVDISGNPNERHGRTYIKSLEIYEGKYIGRKEPYKISFSPWLNSMIGGRGSGKSAVLKFMRMVLDRGDELPPILLKDYEDFVKVPANRTDLGMLQKDSEEKQGTTVIIDICVDGVDHRLRWNNNSIMEYIPETETWVIAQSIKERFPIRMFSQKQLFEMTGDTGLLFQYLDSQWDSRAWQKRVSDLKREYGDIARNLESLNIKKKRLDELKVSLLDIKKKISVFETDTTKTVLLQKEKLNEQRSSVEAIYSEYASFIQWVESFEEIKPQKMSLESIDEENSAVIEKWANSICSVVASIAELIKANDALFLTEESFLSMLPLFSRIKDNQHDMEQVIEQLRLAGVDDIDRYAELLQEKEKIEGEISKLGEIDQQITECTTLMNTKRLEWVELVRERHNQRLSVLTEWNQLGPLRITLVPFSDLVKNEKAFRQIIRRDNESVFNKEILEYDDDGNLTKKGLLFFMSKETGFDEKLLELDRMKKKVLDASLDFGKRFSDYLKKHFYEHSESIAELELWIPYDSLKLEINMNNKGKARYRSIDAGSPGQRTSAILSLILGISAMPIVIDQPEDDLDTRNITDIVVSSINTMKKRQQIIVVTHNPNIVVNTNSEQVIQLDYNNGQIENACCGALQCHDVRDAICEVMEGGKDALEKRYYRIFKALEE